MVHEGYYRQGLKRSWRFAVLLRVGVATALSECEVWKELEYQYPIPYYLLATEKYELNI